MNILRQGINTLSGIKEQSVINILLYQSFLLFLVDGNMKNLIYREKWSSYSIKFYSYYSGLSIT